MSAIVKTQSSEQSFISKTAFKGAEMGVGTGLAYGILSTISQETVKTIQPVLSEPGFFGKWLSQNPSHAPTQITEINVGVGAYESSLELAVSIPVKWVISAGLTRIVGGNAETPYRNFATDVVASVGSVGLSALALQAGLGYEMNMTNFLINQGIGLGMTIGSTLLNKGLECLSKPKEEVQSLEDPEEPIENVQEEEVLTPNRELENFLIGRGYSKDLFN